MTRPGLALMMFGCLLAGEAAFAEVSQDPAYWFKRSAEAAQTVNFDGHCVYINDGRMSSLKVTHRVENGQAIEHVVHVNGPHVQLERRSGELQISPGGSDSRRSTRALAARRSCSRSSCHSPISTQPTATATAAASSPSQRRLSRKRYTPRR